MPVENKSMSMLIAMNLVLIVIVIWLIVYILDDSSPQPDNWPATIKPSAGQQMTDAGSRRMKTAPAESTGTQQPITPVELMTEIKAAINMDQDSISVDERAAQAIDKFKNTMGSAESSSDSLSDATDDNKRSKQTDFLKKLKGLDKLSQEDAEYLQQYRTMKAKSISTDTQKQVSSHLAKSVGASTAQKDIDYFNKIDVSQGKLAGRSSKLTLAQQVQSLVVSKSSGAVVQPDASDTLYSKASEQDYIASITPAAGERANETRIIRVKRGDTLWRIATRAYGSGFEYPRIYAANPHLTNPNLITTGEYLRVPL